MIPKENPPPLTTGLHGGSPGGDLLRRIVNRGRRSRICRKLPPTTAPTIVTGGGGRWIFLVRAGGCLDDCSGINTLVEEEREKVSTLPVDLARHG